MQLYFPHINTHQGAISMFDYIVACRDCEDRNVIFESDLNLELTEPLPGGQGRLTVDTPLNSPEVASFLGFLFANWSIDNGQMFQDLYVLWKLQNKTNGTFVEIGTAWPSGLNNTWFLESRKNWKGVLVEPNPKFHTAIRAERKSPLEPVAIHTNSNDELTFVVPNDFDPAGFIELNSEHNVGLGDINSENKFTVKTLTMVDLLSKYSVDKNFDYLSFDTTGNESDIGSIKLMLDGGYIPKIITVGHNFKSHRNALCDMLQSYGYRREFDFLSRYDDWYYYSGNK
jgi:hypothetical protein